MHAGFVAWCDLAGETPWKPRNFGRALGEKGGWKVKASTINWAGFAWKDDELARDIRQRAEALATIPSRDHGRDFDGPEDHG